MWKARLKNGTMASEETHKWSEIKGDIDELSFEYNNIIFKFPKSNRYFQFKTASAPLSGGKAELESQTVGCFTDNDKKVLLRFNLKKKEIELITLIE